MKVQIWNAYASNNSGSYTIVGTLPSAEVAAEVAASLRQVIEAHTAWLAAPDRFPTSDTSPLAAFCRDYGLSSCDEPAGGEDWPQYSKDNRPRVAVVGRQLMVHHPYTVSLPRMFGEIMYKRGGRVQHEENHAHHPIALRASFWWGWTKEELATMELQRPQVASELMAAEGPLKKTIVDGWPPACRVGDKAFDAPPLLFAVVFQDLVDGVAELSALAKAHSANLHIQIAECPDREHDPFGDLRPSNWGLERFDVTLTDPGDNRAALVTRVRAELNLREDRIRSSLLTLPWRIVQGVDAARAAAIASALRQGGATVAIGRNDY